MRSQNTLRSLFAPFSAPKSLLLHLHCRARRDFHITCRAFSKTDSLFLSPALTVAYPPHLQAQKARKGPNFRPPPIFLAMQASTLAERIGSTETTEAEGLHGVLPQDERSCEPSRWRNARQPITKSVSFCFTRLLFPSTVSAISAIRPRASRTGLAAHWNAKERFGDVQQS